MEYHLTRQEAQNFLSSYEIKEVAHALSELLEQHDPSSLELVVLLVEDGEITGMQFTSLHEITTCIETSEYVIEVATILGTVCTTVQNKKTGIEMANAKTEDTNKDTDAIFASFKTVTEEVQDMKAKFADINSKMSSMEAKLASMEAKIVEGRTSTTTTTTVEAESSTVATAAIKAVAYTVGAGAAVAVGWYIWNRFSGGEVPVQTPGSISN